MALAALEIVNRVVPLHITWVCQVKPKASSLSALANTKLDLQYIISPSQVLPPFTWTHLSRRACLPRSTELLAWMWVIPDHHVSFTAFLAGGPAPHLPRT